eukprot:scaffold115519_cov22-Tisochrysis_lutea.AAC.2
MACVDSCGLGLDSESTVEVGTWPPQGGGFTSANRFIVCYLPMRDSGGRASYIRAVQGVLGHPACSIRA